MKSGLEGRNNQYMDSYVEFRGAVSMKSGLEGRNNRMRSAGSATNSSLNEVRPRRPEQSRTVAAEWLEVLPVSMKSGLEGRNNRSPQKAALTRNFTSTCELSAPPGPIKPLC